MTDSGGKYSRTLVNVLGVPSILALIILGGPWYSGLILIVMLLGIQELDIFFRKNNSRPLFIPLSIAIIVLAYNFYYSLEMSMEILILLVMIIAIMEIFRKEKRPFNNISAVAFGFVWIGLMLGSLILVRNFESGGYPIGFELTLAMVLSIWLCDSAAMVFGKKWGRKKILPAVSPNKSWVGSIAGLAASLLVMFFLYFTDFAFIGYPTANGFFNGWLTITDTLVLAVIFGVFGQLGDFAESLLKREAGVKDTSSFLQGHGGILDRFDSLSFAAPLVFIYSKYFIT